MQEKSESPRFALLVLCSCTDTQPQDLSKTHEERIISQRVDECRRIIYTNYFLADLQSHQILSCCRGRSAYLPVENGIIP